MPLSEQKLADEIKAATEGLDVATLALTKMGKAIADHIVANTIINFGWAAIDPIPPNPPDPITSGAGKVLSCVIVLTPSSATVPAVAQKHMGTEIAAGVTTAMYNMDPPFSTSPGTMVGIPLLELDVQGADRDAALLTMATQICDWLKAFIPTVPCPGSRTKFVGVGTPTGVS